MYGILSVFYRPLSVVYCLAPVILFIDDKLGLSADLQQVISILECMGLQLFSVVPCLPSDPSPPLHLWYTGFVCYQ